MTARVQVNERAAVVCDALTKRPDGPAVLLSLDGNSGVYNCVVIPVDKVDRVIDALRVSKAAAQS